MIRARTARAVVAALAASLVVAGCGSSHHHADSSQPDAVRMTSSAGQAEVLLRPTGAVRGLVVFMHGAGSDQDQLLDDSGLFPVRDALLAGGYAIVASDAHGDNMGNPASVADQLLAASDARAKLGVVDPVDILAFSMGGLDALLTASSHRLAGLHALALLSPAVDQQVFLGGPFGDTITAAFGHPTPAQVPAAVRRSDPVAQPVASYRGYTYRFWHSPADTTVPASQSATMARLLSFAGVDAPVTALTGDHGDLSALEPAAVLDLFSTSTDSS